MVPNDWHHTGARNVRYGVGPTRYAILRHAQEGYKLWDGVVLRSCNQDWAAFRASVGRIRGRRLQDLWIAEQMRVTPETLSRKISAVIQVTRRDALAAECLERRLAEA